LNNDNVTEIRWHARGGQGAVTAAKTLVEMVLPKGLYFQAFPEYGPERMGAPIQIFNRISPEPIFVYCGVTEPDIVVVVDDTLMEVVDVTSGLKDGGTILVNTHLEPGELKKLYPQLERYKLYNLDATHLAMEIIGRPFANVPMLGALLFVTDLMKKDEAGEILKKSFGKRFPEKVVEKNVTTLTRAYEEVKS